MSRSGIPNLGLVGWSVLGMLFALMCVIIALTTHNFAFLIIVFGVTVLILIIGPVLRELLFTDVPPERAKIMRDVETGETRALLPGRQKVRIGREVEHSEVDLRYDARDAFEYVGTLADQTQVHFLVGVIEQRVDRDAPKRIILAGTAIDFAERDKHIRTRVVAALEEKLNEYGEKDLFQDDGKAHAKRQKEIEEHINDKLKSETEPGSILKDFGIKERVAILVMIPHERITDAAAELSAAKMEGRAIKDKAEAAGVDPMWILAGETLKGILGERGSRRQRDRHEEKDAGKKDGKKGGDK